MALQIFAGRAVFLDRTSGRDVIGRYRIPQNRQRFRIGDIRDRRRLHAHAFEVGRARYIGAGRVPAVGIRRLDIDRLPVLVALVDVGIAGDEHFAVDIGRAMLAHLFVGRPDVGQHHVIAVLILADRRVGDVFRHRSLEGVSDHERWAGKEVRAHVGRYAAFEIAVARKDGRRDDVVAVDRLGDRRSERARIADAGGAAITDEIEPERVEIGLQAALLEIVGDDLRPGCQRRLDPGLRLQALFIGLLGNQPRCDQHIGVRRVGAAGDGGNHDVAVADVMVLAVDLDTRRLVLLVHRGEIAVEQLVHLRQRHAVLRALGPGKAGHDLRDVEFERLGEDWLVLGGEPHALFFRIGFDQRDRFFVAPGQAHVFEGLLVDAEEAAGCAVFGRHVGDRRAIGEREVGDAFAVEFHEPADHADFAQHLNAGQHQVGGGHAFRHGAGQLEADDFGDEHGYRLAEHSRFGFDTADAPAQHTETVDHGGVAVGADAGVGIGDQLAIIAFGRPHALAKIFQVHLVADAGTRGHCGKVPEALRTPFEEVVAFRVTGVFEFDVLFERLGVAEFVDHDRVVDHEIDRNLRIDLGRFAAQLADGVTHCGKVHHAGDAGEILQQHACRAILDFLAGGGVLLPVRDRLRIVGGYGEAAIFEAEHVLEQDLQAEGQLRHVADCLLRLGEGVIGVILAVHGEG